MFAAAPIVATVDNFNILANYIKVGGKLAVNFSNYPSIKHELSETVKLLLLPGLLLLPDLTKHNIRVRRLVQFQSQSESKVTIVHFTA